MKILVVQNRYRHRTGEDSTFDQEVELLQKHGQEVKTWTVDNRNIKSDTLYQNLRIALNTVWSNSSYRKLCQTLQDFEPDVVHVHNFLPLLSPAIFYACKAYNIPVVQTIQNYRLGCPGTTFFRDHQVCELCPRTSLLQSIRYGCYRNSKIQTATVAAMLQIHRWLGTWDKVVSGYIAVSPFVRDKLIELGIPEKKIYVKPNFIRLTKSQKKEIEFGLYYLFVGRLIEEKGILPMLKAYELADPEFPLVIVGGGDLEIEKIVAEVAERNPKIHYVGRQTRKEVMEWMQGAIALLFPSIWYEGFPISILEAYSCSLPVIASDIGAVRSAIIPNKTGLYCTPDSPESLSRKLKQVETQRETWIKMKQDLLDNIDEVYFPKGNYERLLEIYHEIIIRKKESLFLEY